MTVLMIAAISLMSLYFGTVLWIQYQHDELVMMSLGLIGLGLVNALSGLAFTLAGTGLGVIAVGAGAISMNLGQWLNELAYEKSPHPELLAGRVAFSFFATGLVFLVETS